MNRIYVAATSQHVGKTTSTLGLISALRDRGLSVGYCKPVGQQFIDVGNLRADKDAFLFSRFMDFDLVPDLHSPVILGPGATTAYLDSPTQFTFPTKLIRASKILQQNHDMVVYEGTGHPGVGSVVGLSNAQVASHLQAGVIMIVEAGIGKTLDLLDLNLAVFERENVPIAGVIVNKCEQAKIEKVKHYVGIGLKKRGIELLGVLPYEEELALPLLDTIAKAVNAKVLYNEDLLDNKVRNIIAGSLIDLNELKNFSNQLLVVSISRLDEALKKLNEVTRLVSQDTNPLSGIILTGRGELTEAQCAYFQSQRIPVLYAKIDTYEVVMKISRIEVKINVRTPWKVQKAISLFKEHINLDPIFAYQT